MQWSRSWCTVTMVFGAFCGSASAAGAQITVGENVHLSTAIPNQNNGEPVVCAVNDDPAHLIAATMVDMGWRGDEHFHQGAVYLTEDSGRSWSATLDLRGQVERVADPSCASGPDGEVVVSFMTETEGAGPGMRLSLFRSDDGGRSWGESPAAPHSRGIDRPYVAIDAGTGPFRGRVYVSAHLTAERTESGERAPRAMALYRSVDGGATLEPPALFPMTDVRSHTTPGEVAVLSDGTVVGLYSEYRACANEEGRTVRCTDGRATRIRAYSSSDGGVTISEPTTVSTTRHEDVPILLGVDRGDGPFRDRLYAAWVDSVPGYRATRLMISSSSDGGRTWSPARPVSDNTPLPPPLAGADVSRPALAVNDAGVVGISWYDERESSGREHLDEIGYHLRFSASLDGGETFLPSTRVSVFPSSDQGAEALNATVFPPLAELESVDGWVSLSPFWVGHTSGLTADKEGRFHPVWVDARTGAAQLWTATVAVNGVGVENGSPELSTLADLTNETVVEVSDVRYDRRTGTISGKLRVRNISHAPLVPRYVRVITLAAGVGVTSIVGADNGMAGPGAVWGVADLVPDRGLRPGEASRERDIQFTIDDPHQAEDGRVGTGFRNDLLHFDVRVLGRRQ